MRITVKCDNPSCDWIIHEQKFMDWYQKPCPKCGYTPIINKQEKRLLEIAEVMDTISKIAGFVGIKLKKTRVRTTRISPEKSRFDIHQEK